ncbi:hypothetical protein [Lactococcus kimchii]|uniref:hypothetical protein n=1 Tax=Lactococcus sp. S-13 TaxID=2507158 RepID=UPI001022DF3B|nr:hypothetical protein [Lactococcus sp. S-13]RZI47901.1 hypothetical protein EQJ87_10800 [Lactococcus sp. S-13]
MGTKKIIKDILNEPLRLDEGKRKGFVMDIFSKGAIIQPRQLKRLNGKTIIFQSGEQGRIAYPLVIIKRGKEFCHVSLTNHRVFKEIVQIKFGKTVIAERVNHNSPLYSTGKGISRVRKKYSF